MSQNAVGQLRLSSETLGKLTSESTLLTPEVKPTKPVRGSVLLTKGKAESHGSGSQKQHHQHASETPQVQIRAPQKEGWDPPSSFPLIPLLLLPLLLLASRIGSAQPHSYRCPGQAGLGTALYHSWCEAGQVLAK